MSKSIAIRFTEPAEFVADLALDRAQGLVERDLVRLAKVGRPLMDGAVTRVTVEAAAIVDRRVARLTVDCGELWGHTADEQVRQRATDAMDDLRAGLLEAGFEIRAGLFEDEL